MGNIKRFTNDTSFVYSQKFAMSILQQRRRTMTQPHSIFQHFFSRHAVDKDGFQKKNKFVKLFSSSATQPSHLNPPEL